MGSQNSSRAPFIVDKFILKTVPNGAGNGAALPSLQGHTVLVKAVLPAGAAATRVFIGRVADGLAALPATFVADNKCFPLADGEFLTFEVANANQLCMLADGAGAFLAIATGHF